MGKRQNNLVLLLQQETADINTQHFPKPSLSDLRSSLYYDEIYSIYKKLNGTQLEIPCNIGSYDCIVNNTIVELDEENHFNRYRAITLNASIYGKTEVCNAKKYLSFCKKRESACQTRGKYWNSKSSDHWFGLSDPPGELGKNGSSRWRQRAFYDLLRDYMPLVLQIPIRRISIYDIISHDGMHKSVNDVLTIGDKHYSKSLYKFLFPLNA